MLNKRLLPILLFGVLTTIASVVALIIYLIFALTQGPTTIRNQYIPMWLNLLLLFHSLQTVYLIAFKRLKFIINSFFYLDLAYFILSSAGCITLLVFYSFTRGKIDAIIWSSLTVVISVLNCIVMIYRRSWYRNEVAEATKETIQMKSSIKPDHEPPDFFEHLREDDLECPGCQCRRVLNVVFKFVFLVILAGLIAGASVIGIGYLQYPPRGQFSVVKLNDSSNRDLKIHWLCDGPQVANQPVFIFDGSGSHVMADYYGLQLVLAENNRRSCIFDLPGQGYSDDLYNNLNDLQVIYHNMITSFGEEPPFILVGWGGGGETFYKYAYNHPEMVHSIVFMDTYPIDIEFQTPYVLKNWTEAQRDQYKKDELRSRRSFVDLINSIAVPFGLMPLFIPPSEAYPPEIRAEIRWFFVSDRTWVFLRVAQRHWLGLLENNENIFEKYKIDQNIPINLLSTALSDEQITNITCIKNKRIDPESDECQYEIAANRFMTEEKEKLVDLSVGGRIIRCTDDDCGLGVWVDEPQFTVEKLLELYDGK